MACSITCVCVQVRLPDMNSDAVETEHIDFALCFYIAHNHCSVFATLWQHHEIWGDSGDHIPQIVFNAFHCHALLVLDMTLYKLLLLLKMSMEWTGPTSLVARKARCLASGQYSCTACSS
ncbi:TPA: hypothetical protein ACH3X1_013976 [Trebouxia sp. C0004]